MSAPIARRKRKRSTVALIVRMTPGERDALSEVVFAEGFNSMATWFRRQAVAKLKEAGALPPREAGHG